MRVFLLLLLGVCIWIRCTTESQQHKASPHPATQTLIDIDAFTNAEEQAYDDSVKRVEDSLSEISVKQQIRYVDSLEKVLTRLTTDFIRKPTQAKIIKLNKIAGIVDGEAGESFSSTVNEAVFTSKASYYYVNALRTMKKMDDLKIQATYYLTCTFYNKHKKDSVLYRFKQYHKRKEYAKNHTFLKQMLYHDDC